MVRLARSWECPMYVLQVWDCQSLLDICSFCPTDQKFASCSDDGTVRIWDFVRCYEEKILRGKIRRCTRDSVILMWFIGVELMEAFDHQCWGSLSNWPVAHTLIFSASKVLNFSKLCSGNCLKALLNEMPAVYVYPYNLYRVTSKLKSTEMKYTIWPKLLC